MAFSSKPTYIPEWASTDVYNAETETYNVVAPDDAKKELGWDAYEKPPRNYMNWLQRGNYQWIEYFEQFFDDDHTFRINAIEGDGATGVTIEGVTFLSGAVAEDLKIQPGTTAARLRLQTSGSGTGDADGFGVVLSDALSTALLWVYEQFTLQIGTNGTDRMRFAANSPQIQIANGARDLVNTSGYVVADKQRETGAASGVLNTKIIEIGDWNMDSTASVAVTHGVNATKIRAYEAMIMTDGGTPIPFSNDPSREASLQTGTSIVLSRTTSGIFDSPNYDSTSYNRGWVTIWYVD